ncbi:hypothetical protein PCANC_01896 [Puccinia coronata f. sp. avenae]|uniref:Uncharacterized protein n=1 Tax=Puccinia coronata f. sp. avenae TaxID=200324 RepID=A0A2N5W4C3_9BASI|nr:hypothetical protein PCANC_01896 [Puccinia coronata f. sp. avenae]
MSTCRSSSSLLPFKDNPKAIICDSNAAKRSAAHLVGRLHHFVQQRAAQSRLPPLPPLPPPPAQPADAPAPSLLPRPVTPLPPAVEPPAFSTPPQFKVTPFYPPNSLPSPFLRPLPTRPTMSTQPNDDKPDYLQMLVETQHNQLLQAQQDCAASAKRMTRFAEASARRIARLEEAILLMSTKHQASPENRHAAALTSDDRVNLQRFCTTNGPLYSGLFHNMEQFLNWVNAVQIFLTSKGVSHNTDKIRISFASFRTIQTLVNFDGNLTNLGDERPVIISDLELAETVVYSLPTELKVLVKNHKVLLKRPFKYTDFESRTQLFYDGLPCKSVFAQRTAGGLTQSTSTSVTRMLRDDTIWRVHSFLDSQGRCHHCKKRCGSVPGSCPSSLNWAYVEVPLAFITPPKPSDYKPPKAWAPPSSGAGKPTQAPAGWAPAKVLVSAIENNSVCPDLDAASVASFATIDKELRLTREEQYVSPPPSDWIILLFQCGDISLRALVDTSS